MYILIMALDTSAGLARRQAIHRRPSLRGLHGTTTGHECPYDEPLGRDAQRSGDAPGDDLSRRGSACGLVGATSRRYPEMCPITSQGITMGMI